MSTNRRAPLVFWLVHALIITLAGCATTGCAVLNEKYYLSAADPDTGTTNYYRVGISGWSFFSSSKFSSGFYDRNAVERLFGENAVEQEYLATRIDKYGADGKRLDDIRTRLDQSIAAKREFDKQALEQAMASLSELAARFRVRIEINKTLYGDLKSSLDWADKQLEDAKNALNPQVAAGKDNGAPPTAKPAAGAAGTGATTNNPTAAATQGQAPDLNTAARCLSGAQGVLSEMNGMFRRASVHFFDGAGNELDVAAKSQVIFVASDASRFLEGLRQLAVDESSSRDVIQIVLGPQIREARRFAVRADSAARMQQAINKRLEKVTEVGDLQGDAGRDRVRARLLEAANVVSGGQKAFLSTQDIKAALEGGQP